MPGSLCLAVLFLIITKCLSQDPRPTFPDVFQTEMQGIFVEENKIIEIDATMFYDRKKNRAALFVTKEDESSRLVYNFEDDESFTISDDDCEGQEIPEVTGFFPYTVKNGKKILSPAEEAFCFTDAGERTDVLLSEFIPAIKYTAKNVNVKQFGQSKCDLVHVFSKPDVTLPTCRDGPYCSSTIISFSVECFNDDGDIILKHFYMFSSFVSEIQDESVFLPPPGIHCDMKNTKEIPKLPSYCSFTFDTIERRVYSQETSEVVNTHKRAWYDSEYGLIRTDEFDRNGLLYSSRIIDLEIGIAFTIIATHPSCGIFDIANTTQLNDVTLLPKSFFSQNDSNEVYVGKRKVHGMIYDVWSRLWIASLSDARIVEEAYFLQIAPNNEITSDKVDKSYSQISHVDMYMYERNDETNDYELQTLKYFAINNYRSVPKEFAAFDVSACFKNNQMKMFSMEIKDVPFVKESQTYKELIEHLYNQIIAATGISVIRISKLRGVFDGINLVGIKGSILDNSQISQWPEDKRGPGVEETFKLIQKAASENKLSVTLMGEGKKEIKIHILSVEEIKDPSGPTNSCYSGASMAAASLALLLIGVLFGIAGYYVFLKKRKPSDVHVKMSDIYEK